MTLLFDLKEHEVEPFPDLTLKCLLLQAAAAVQVTKREEQQLLERIRQEFGAKHVVRVCSMYESDKVLEGARRLLQHADVIKGTVDLRGASLAIDDCYEVWGSGFISIPYDFTLQELQPQLIKLLGGGMHGHSRNAVETPSTASRQGWPVAAAIRQHQQHSLNPSTASAHAVWPRPSVAALCCRPWVRRPSWRRTILPSLLRTGPKCALATTAAHIR